MSEFTRNDYLRIKWPFVALLASMAFGGSLFAGLRALDQSATRDLRDARNDFNQAQERVDKIAEEEATIRANIGEFRTIADSGILKGEDRLQMREYFSELRAEFHLWPINSEVSEQTSLPIAYGELNGQQVPEPGRPISLQMSTINFTVPLLHENDFSNLLSGLLAKPELLQVASCMLNATGGREPNYLRLGQHLNAACELAWYTFHIDDGADAAGDSQ